MSGVERRQRTGVLVVGAGGAGLAAALEARASGEDVLVVTGGRLDDSKTSRAQGGMQAAFGPGDSADGHFRDTLKAGGEGCDTAVVRTLVNNAVPTVEWLEGLGVRFDRDDEGRYALRSGAGLSAPRVLSIGADSTGRNLVSTLVRAVRDREIRVWEHAPVVSLVREGGTFIARIRRGDAHVGVEASAVVLATGGFEPPERKAGLDASLTRAVAADGLQIAGALGASVKDADLQQYHPTGVVSPRSLRRERLPETLRAAGAVLLNASGVPFTDPMITRGMLSDAIVRECAEGRGVATDDGRVGVWLTTSRVDGARGRGYLAKTYPVLYEKFLEAGHDIAARDVLVYPIVHYSLGGIRIDSNAATSVSGLFAAGESTYGVHGKERLMGNSLMDIFVFGRIAGRSAALHSAEIASR